METDTATPRNQLRPVKYNYADSFYVTYVVSVVAANIAEMGELSSNKPNKEDNHLLNQTLPLFSHLPPGLDQNPPTNSGRSSRGKVRRQH